MARAATLRYVGIPTAGGGGGAVVGAGGVAGAAAASAKAAAAAADRAAYAQYTIVGSAKAAPVPEGVSMEDAVAACLQGMTAHYLLRNCHPLQVHIT